MRCPLINGLRGWAKLSALAPRLFSLGGICRFETGHMRAAAKATGEIAAEVRVPWDGEGMEL
jgi:hypothetical protein